MSTFSEMQLCNNTKPKDYFGWWRRSARRWDIGVFIGFIKYQKVYGVSKKKHFFQCFANAVHITSFVRVYGLLFIICCFNCPFVMTKSLKCARATPVGRTNSRWNWSESVRIQEVNERCGGPSRKSLVFESSLSLLKPHQWCCLYLKQPVKSGSPHWILSNNQHPELWGPGGGLLDLLWAACFHSWRPDTLHFTSF